MIDDIMELMLWSEGYGQVSKILPVDYV